RIFPQAKVSNGYGTTEIGPATFGPHPDGLETPPLSIGFPMDGVQTSLRGGKDSSEGELFIKTGMQTEGYLNNDTLTDVVFKDGWYATGDLMHSDKDGFFYFDGRADDMFVSGGENIHPSAIEKMLSTHSAVTEAAVVPLGDPIKGSIPVAFVVGDIAPEDLKAFALQNGPAYAHPRFIEVLPALPLAGTNKVDKSTLKRRAQTLFGGIRP
ncbi:MAG: fatty acid--CoA ligase family protein, partial [Pseudomonadota bacterium]